MEGRGSHNYAVGLLFIVSVVFITFLAAVTYKFSMRQRHVLSYNAYERDGYSCANQMNTNWHLIKAHKLHPPALIIR